jgi:chromosomal replication initiation ATPase DnaA
MKLIKVNTMKDTFCPCCGHKLTETAKPDRGLYLQYVHIIDACTQYYGVTRTALLSKSREKQVTSCRHVIIYLIRKYTKYSPGTIAKYLNRDRTTILYAIERANNAFFTKGDIYPHILEIEQKLGFNQLRKAS